MRAGLWVGFCAGAWPNAGSATTAPRLSSQPSLATMPAPFPRMNALQQLTPFSSEHETGRLSETGDRWDRAVEHRLRAQASRRRLGEHRLTQSSAAGADGDEPPALLVQLIADRLRDLLHGTLDQDHVVGRGMRPTGGQRARDQADR